MSGRIFINYRRADSRWFAGRLDDRLRAHFGDEAVFMDVSDMRAGVDFVEVLQEAVRSCDVLIAVIGPSWLEIKDEHGGRRLDNPEDYVRIELAEALERDIRVIPLLVGETLLPRRNDLPGNLKPLSRRHAIKVDHETFIADTRRLIEQIEDGLAEAEQMKAKMQQQFAKEQAQAELDRQINDLLAQAEIALEAKEWSAAEELLVAVLAKDADNLVAKARLEIVRRKTQAQDQATKEKLAKEQAQVELQRQVEERLAQAESAMDAEDWPLASQKLNEVLSLDMDNRIAKAGLTVVQRNIQFQEEAKKLAEDQARLERRRQEKDAKKNEPPPPEKEQEPEKPPARRISPQPEEDQGSARKSLKKIPAWIWGVFGIVIVVGVVLGIVLGGGNVFPAAAVRPTVTETAASTATHIPTFTSTSSPTATSNATSTPDGIVEDPLTPPPPLALGIGSSYINPIDGVTAMYIPAGSFLMGYEYGDADEGPVHEVYLDAFWMYPTEVTNAQYRQCVEEGKCTLPDNDKFYGSNLYNDYPVLYVDWVQSQAYCKWAGGRLPTEAEWDKAARGGLEGKTKPWGNEDPTCTPGATNGAQLNGCPNLTIQVATFMPNGYGLYDMAGNVWEWVADWYASDYYAISSGENPQGPESGDYHVLRGGAWSSILSDYRLTNRNKRIPGYTGSYIGFRCVIPLVGD